MSKLYKELSDLKSKQTKNNPVRKWAKELSRPCIEEDIQIAHKHLRFPILLLIKEI